MKNSNSKVNIATVVEVVAILVITFIFVYILVSLVSAITGFFYDIHSIAESLMKISIQLRFKL